MMSRRNVTESRAETLAQALRLEYLTVGWNLVEGIVAVGAALAVGVGTTLTSDPVRRR